MNERITELAKQAGIELWRFDYVEKEFERFAELVRQDEREACAKLCNYLDNFEPQPRPDECATAIRARGEK